MQSPRLNNQVRGIPGEDMVDTCGPLSTTAWVSIKNLDHIIKVDFLFGSRQQEL